MKTTLVYPIVRRTNLAAAAAALLLAVAGCAHKPQPAVAKAPPPPPPLPPQFTDMAIVDAIGDSGIRSAIVTQHTLFPYHFAPDSEALNELGQNELGVLITHLHAVGGGDLNIRAGDAPEPLYTARVRYVRDMLRKGGVDPAAVRIADAPPGGEPARSTAVLKALEADANKKDFQSGGEIAGSSSNGGGGGGGGNSSGGGSSGTGGK
ncbi:MAG: hypothetical protein JWL69_4474 [Phycisphaerales bacterium]|nr:hypothetical protein [Phycisphaerales bacterium]MDB5357546.1 hypothetical protein [Phycisphaerales bacterium]